MREITSRLTQVRGEFEIIAFGDKVRGGGDQGVAARQIMQRPDHIGIGVPQPAAAQSSSRCVSWCLCHNHKPC